jgi:hypothetical protein
MALIIADRVQETSTSTGTGDFMLAGAKTGYRAFNSVLAVGDTTYYTIVDLTGAWEVGLGTYSAANTLTRTMVLASSTGSEVMFGSGAKDVFISAVASILPVRPIKSFTTTINTVANTAATVTHNLFLPTKDQFTVRLADSTGQTVSARVVSVDINSLQVTTSVGVTGLIVTVVG